MKIDLSGKTALVTGSTAGIGNAIAKGLAATGAEVVVNGRGQAKVDAAVAAIEQAVPGAKVRGIAADVSSAEGCRALLAALPEVDILVNNAGIFRGGAVADWSLADIDATIAVNIRAVVLASQAAAAHLGQGGRIISIGSCLADRVVEPNIALYAMSKAALIGFTKGLARDLGPRGITVNIVHPGSTDTDMNPANGPGAEAQLARMAIPAYGKPEDIAAAVAYLASDEARFVTGTGLAVDGGVNT